MAIMRKQEGFSGWGGELDSPFFKGLEALEDSLLTEDGLWARDFCIKSMRRNAQFHSDEILEDDKQEEDSATDDEKG